MATSPRGPLNSSQPVGSIVVGGVYNVVTPAPKDEQPCALQLDSEGNLFVSIAGSENPASVIGTVKEQGASNVASGQVTITSAGVQIVGIRATREAVVIVNLGTTPVYIGPVGVTTATGVLLIGVVGAAVSIPTTAALYGIVASTSEAVSFLEAYN